MAGEKKKATKPSGPSSAQKVYEALKSKTSRGKGLSRAYIYKWIGDNYPGTSVAAVRRAITKGCTDGTFKAGETKARFLLTDEGKKKFGPKPKKKKPKKKKAKKKKPKKKKSKKKKPKKKKSKKKKASKKKKDKKKSKKESSKKKKSSKKKAAKKKKKSGKKKAAKKKKPAAK